MITYNTATNPVATQDNEEGEVKKVYVLLKELPDCKPGTLAVWCEHSNAYEMEKTGTWVSPHKYLYYSKGTVEQSPNWFKEKEQPKEERIFVSSIGEQKFKVRVPPPNGYNHSNIVLRTTSKIPEEKYEAVKKAIESVLNGK